MHKNIARIIYRIIIESPYNDIKCDIIPGNSMGFWKVIIYFDTLDNAHSEALVKILDYIGMIYGETLSITDTNPGIKIVS